MAVWSPQAGPQADAISAREIWLLLFGGARGGGKSDFLIGDYLQDIHYGEGWKGVIFRKTYSELEELMFRCDQLCPPLGGVWNVQKKTWTFPTGATLKLRYMEHERDAARYQGHQYAFIGWDELTNWATPAGFWMLIACLRGTEDIPFRRIRCSANAGGKGHQWVKDTFKIGEMPLGCEVFPHETTGRDIVFIPSKVTDNKILLDAQPDYVDNLKGVGSPELVKMWLDGDWSVIAGAYFPEWDQHKHIIRPHKIPNHWTKFTAFDWGRASPFCVLWFAVSDGEHHDGVPKYPRGSLIVYREYYGADGPNKGIDLDADKIALNALAMEGAGEKINYRVADPAIFSKLSGPSIGETMALSGMAQRKADNARVIGWDQVRMRLSGNNKSENEPLLYVASTCIDLIRTLPALQHDETNIEDCDTDQEDHAPDTLRYGVQSRSIVRDAPAGTKELKGQSDMTINELIAHNAKLRKRRENLL